MPNALSGAQAGLARIKEAYFQPPLQSFNIGISSKPSKVPRSSNVISRAILCFSMKLDANCNLLQ